MITRITTYIQSTLYMMQGRSSKWAKVRREHLDKNPFCIVCGSTDDLEVHHIEPFHERPELELVEDNLCTLCESSSHNCHFIFGHLMNWKRKNKRVREVSAIMFDELQIEKNRLAQKELEGDNNL